MYTCEHKKNRRPKLLKMKTKHLKPTSQLHFDLEWSKRGQGWYAEFLLKIDLQFLPRKTSARLNSKFDLKTLHTHPGPLCINF